VLVLLVAAGGAFLWYRKASQPAHEGVFNVAGLSGTVTVARDGVAVPYIDAKSEADALFALGFVHAQDRLWQMTLNRRIAQGRLAEIAGMGGLQTDRFLRTLGIYRTAERLTGQLDAPTRALLDAYAAGVNQYLQRRNGPLPPEFLLTGAPAPEPWRPSDSVAWALMMALDLSRTYRDELTRLRLAARFSRAEIDEFKPKYPGEAAPALAEYPEIYRLLGLFRSTPSITAADPPAVPELLGDLLPSGAQTEGIGSNNWVVAGSRTVSGKPLLANDPHLGLTTPAVWYFARLRAPGLEVFGATLPGVPYVILGRNRKVAWGFTNTGPDVQDLYIERVNPGRPDEYQTPDGYARFETRTETISVRGADPVELRIRTTRHGPVLSGVLGAVDQVIDESRYVLSMRWSALEIADNSLKAFREMNRAGNAREFEAALAGFGLAMQNVVFADVEGNIGYVAAGRVPVRKPENDLHGLAPAPGWDARYDWAGWLSFTDLPRAINPADGMVVTANQNITPAGYGHYIASDWTLPYRADRITQLLGLRSKHDVNSFRGIQADTLSLAARETLQAMRRLAPEPRTSAGQLALARLMIWDGTMSAQAPEPLLFHAWRNRLRDRIFEDDLGALAKELVHRSELTRATLLVLRGETRARDWCDDQSTATRETCAEIAGEALDEAMTELARESGRDLLGLRWGEAHRAIYEHRPFSHVALLRDWFELSVPDPGDTYTVNVGQLGLRSGTDWRAPYATHHGPSLRAIYDLAPGATGVWIYGTGQVGHPFSDDYSNLLESWRRVEYRQISWDRPAAQGAQQNILTLKPAAR